MRYVLANDLPSYVDYRVVGVSLPRVESVTRLELSHGYCHPSGSGHQLVGNKDIQYRIETVSRASENGIPARLLTKPPHPPQRGDLPKWPCGLARHSVWIRIPFQHDSRGPALGSPSGYGQQIERLEGESLPS